MRTGENQMNGKGELETKKWGWWGWVSLYVGGDLSVNFELAQNLGGVNSQLARGAN
jgi:hypothetical protein